MSDNSSENEPSMEEILASIRKIISEDTDEGEGVPETKKLSSSELAVEESLELTDKIEDEPLKFEDDVLELGPELEPVALPRMELEPIEEPIATDDAIVSPAAEAISTAALLQLTQSLAGRDVPLGRADRSLEQLVKELMRPMLREWLDEYLPTVVEEVVKHEVQRMANSVKDN